MQTITIALPQVGEGIVEGIIGKWLKQPGETIKKYDPLVEITTDKVNLEIPSPYDGVLTKILAQEGSTIPMAAPIGELETSSNVESMQTDPGNLSLDSNKLTGYLDETRLGIGPTGGASIVHFDTADDPSKVYSPVVNRLAAQHKIDLNSVQGTGMNNRVTKKDILELIATRNSASPPTSLEQITSEPIHGAAPSINHKTLKLTPVRKLIAQNMLHSVSTIPHAWIMIEVDVTDLVAHRRSINESLNRSNGTSITLLPFLINALGTTLADHPKLNASWSEDGIKLFDEINIGVAVAAPDGLVVPVIHSPNHLTITQLNMKLKDLTSKAKKGLLDLSDVQNGTFTLNNTGSLGFVLSKPIINPPQVAILTTEKVQKKPVVMNDEITIRSIMNICMSFDHRVIDGLEASAFLQSLKLGIETLHTNNQSS